MLDGLNPSPRLAQKMQPQSRDKTQGNNFIARNMGKNADLRLKLFRHFFGCQDPTTIPPKKQECPNFKVDSFFRWLRHVWKEAWVLGKNCSVDEQTCKMQGKSEYKTCCGSSRGLEMVCNVIVLLMMGLLMIFTFGMSQL